MRVMYGQSTADEFRMAVYPSGPPRASSLRMLRGLGDEQLKELVAGGSEPAFAVIYDRYMPALLRYCRRILGSTDDAEDAAQAAMIRAMGALSRRPPRRLRPWLYRIAHNEAITLARRHVHNEPAVNLEQADPVADPVEAAVTRARLSQLLSDLHALPGRQRDALVLRELCGRSYNEIAAELGTSEGAAQQTVFEARASLHEFGRGRDTDCLEIQRSISDLDHGRLRSRRVRAHLRSCEYCASFERDLYARRRDFALLLPWAGAGAVPEILGLAGGGARALTQLMRAPIPPDGLRAAAVVAAAAALGVTGLGLQAVATPRGAGNNPRAAAVRLSSDESQAPPAVGRGDAATPAAGTAPTGHGDRQSGPQTASQGGQSRVPAVTPGGQSTGNATSTSVAAVPQSSGGGSPPAHRPLALPVPKPGVGQALGNVGNTAGGAVNNTVGAVNTTAQNTTKAVGDTVSQTGSGVSGAVNSTTQTAGNAVKNITGALP